MNNNQERTIRDRLNEVLFKRMRSISVVLPVTLVLVVTVIVFINMQRAGIAPKHHDRIEKMSAFWFSVVVLPPEK